MNKFECIGRLTKDPELRYTKEGKAVSTFNLAVSNGKEDTTFIKITAFLKTAELIQKYTKKGDLIMVDGTIKNNNYEDKDGNKRFEYTFIANKTEFLSRTNKTTTKEEKGEEMPKIEPSKRIDEIPSNVFADFGKETEESNIEIAF